MEMQREDFLKLCKGPANGGMWHPPASSHPRKIYPPVHTHSGLSSGNATRVLQDWFPAGQLFQFLGSTCMSRGPKQVGGLEGVQLEVLARDADGGYKTFMFSVREALSIAKQISVDNINWLDHMEKTK